MFQEDAAKLNLPSPVIRKIAVHNFLKSCAKQENSKQLVKKSKPGPEEIQCHVQVPSTFEKEFSGNDEGTANLKAKTNDENISMNIHKRKEVCPIVENKEFSNAPGEVAVKNILKSCAKEEISKQPVKKCKSLSKVSFGESNLIQFDKGDTTKLHFSPNVEVSRPLSAFQERRAANRGANSRTYKGPNSDMMAKSCSLLEEEKKGVRNYNMEHNFNGLSLDSSGKLIKFGSSGKVKTNHQGGSQLQISTENMIQPVKFQSNETLQNRSLGVNKNAISNIPEQIIARTNPKGIISQPILRNRKMNDGKRIHHGTSSASGIPFSITHVPIPPSSTKSGHRNITKAAAKVTHIPVTRAFSNSRKRPKVEKQENSTQMNVDQDSSATDSDRDLQVNTREVDLLDPNGMPKHSENVDQDSSATDSDRDLEDQKKLTETSKQSVRLILFLIQNLSCCIIGKLRKQVKN